MWMTKKYETFPGNGDARLERFFKMPWLKDTKLLTLFLGQHLTRGGDFTFSSAKKSKQSQLLSL